MIFVIKFKGYMTNIDIFGIIIDKFYHKKKPCLIILLKVDKDLKVNVHYTILHLSLIVHL